MDAASKRRGRVSVLANTRVAFLHGDDLPRLEGETVLLRENPHVMEETHVQACFQFQRDFSC